MITKNLQQFYLEQLVKVGVESQKAERAANILTYQEFQLISDIWPEWATVFAQVERGLYSKNG